MLKRKRTSYYYRTRLNFFDRSKKRLKEFILNCFIFSFDEFFKKLNGFFVDFLITQSVAGLVEKHHSVFFADVIQQKVFVESIAFAQHSFVIIAVNGVFEVFFGNRNAHFHRNFFIVCNLNIHQTQGIFSNGFSFGKKRIDDFFAF